ncbi:hypothetical protein BDZ85DRAFT_285409 [Elsinoe ampelina]|uniref:Uncharacterized protein n=1 Tax=Elsinoe ampelina TaxID=302913 RepID=A0A6A6G1G5_9PEZI|nr:hypothetical protein BDZ85DRAFT_285409 [Elsinoe ampelina]
MIPIPSGSSASREPSSSQDDATTSDATTTTPPTTTTNSTTAVDSRTARGPVFTYEAMMASATSKRTPPESSPRLTRAAAISSGVSSNTATSRTSPVLTLDKLKESSGPYKTSSTISPNSSRKQAPSIDTFDYPLPAPAFVPTHLPPHSFRYQLHAGDPVPFSTENWADDTAYQCRPDGRPTAHTSLHQLRAKLYELYIGGHTIDESYQTLDGLAANITEVLNLLQTEVIEQTIEREVEHGGHQALVEASDFGSGAFDVMAEFRDQEAEEKARLERELEKVKEDNLLLGCIIGAWREVAEGRAEELGRLKKEGKGKEEQEGGGIGNEEEKEKANDAGQPSVVGNGGKEGEEDSDLNAMLMAALAGDCNASGDAAAEEEQDGQVGAK